MAEAVIQEAVDRISDCVGRSWRQRHHMRDMIDFALAGQQWDPAVRAARMQDDRLMLTINRLPVLLSAVLNEARQGMPRVEVRPISDDADKAVSVVSGGIMRQIEAASDAADVYTDALKWALVGGFGFWQVCDVNEDLRIKGVPDPLSVYWDPEMAGSSSEMWEWAGRLHSVSGAYFQHRWPKADLESWDAIYDEDVVIESMWQDGSNERDLVRILEWFQVGWQAEVELTMGDGQSFGKVAEKEAKAIVQQAQMMGLPLQPGPRTSKRVVKRCWLTANQVLEETAWPGEYIPIVGVWGERFRDEWGHMWCRSLLHDVVDAQTEYNLTRTADTEFIFQQPNAAWLAPGGTIPEGDEEAWTTPGLRTPVLKVKMQPHTQHPIMPQRVVPPQPSTGHEHLSAQAAQDIKDVTGIHDASLGVRSNETSGKAIQARKQQGAVATYAWPYAMHRGMRHSARILLQAMPAFYDGREAHMILGANNTPYIMSMLDEQTGRLRSLGDGSYDVTLRAGFGNSTQREEAVGALTQFMGALGPNGVMIADLVADMMDLPITEQLQERLQMMMGMQQGPGPGPGPGPRAEQGAPNAAV